MIMKICLNVVRMNVSDRSHFGRVWRAADVGVGWARASKAPRRLSAQVFYVCV